MSTRNEEITKALKKHPLGFACGSLAVLLGLFAYLRSSGLAELEVQLAEQIEAGRRQQANIQNATLLPEHLEALTAASATVAQRALDPRALADNQQFFFALEAAVGIKLTDLRQGAVVPPAKGAVYSAIPYTVSAQGTYRPLLQFLREIERSAPLVRFTSVNLVPRREGDTPAAGVEPILALSLNLELLGRP